MVPATVAISHSPRNDRGYARLHAPRTLPPHINQPVPPAQPPTQPPAQAKKRKTLVRHRAYSQQYSRNERCGCPTVQTHHHATPPHLASKAPFRFTSYVFIFSSPPKLHSKYRLCDRNAVLGRAEDSPRRIRCCSFHSEHSTRKRALAADRLTPHSYIQQVPTTLQTQNPLFIASFRFVPTCVSLHWLSALRPPMQPRYAPTCAHMSSSAVQCSTVVDHLHFVHLSARARVPAVPKCRYSHLLAISPAAESPKM
jgi:hypothetical protein